MIRPLAAAAFLMWAGVPLSAHRLDEYLQATMIRVEKDRVQAQVYLTPGVAVSPALLAGIDADADGAISAAEQRAYAERVYRDLSLTMDGKALRLQLVSTKFADIEELKQGRGGIEIELLAGVPNTGSERKLIFENRHEPRIAAYLVNCITPRDPGIHVIAQRRNYQQSHYELDYQQTGAGHPTFAAWSVSPVWGGAAMLLLLTPLARRWRQRA